MSTALKVIAFRNVPQLSKKNKTKDSAESFVLARPCVTRKISRTCSNEYNLLRTLPGAASARYLEPYLLRPPLGTLAIAAEMACDIVDPCSCRIIPYLRSISLTYVGDFQELKQFRGCPQNAFWPVMRSTGSILEEAFIHWGYLSYLVHKHPDERHSQSAKHS